RNYGGLRHKLPVTFWAMMIGTLAITGVGVPLVLIGHTPIGFAGFISKDAIIEGVYAAEASYAFWMLVVAALMTSFYSWRLMFMTFYGTPRGDAHTHDHAHESPRVMTAPLVILMVGSVVLGMAYYGAFVDSHAKEFFGKAIFMGAENTVLKDYHYVPKWVKLSPFIVMLLGLGAAWYCYIHRPDTPGKIAEANPGLYRFLLNKWYIDEVYNVLFVEPAKFVGRFLWKKGDGATIDGGINGLAMGIIPFFTKIAGRAQSGYVFHYAFAMFIGIAVIMLYMVLRGAS
ncbi:MAG: proton-conducting transporter membrane subunit, partial [Pseudomonadota bacterium]